MSDRQATVLIELRTTVPTEHEIIAIRTLSTEEATEIKDAADLIVSVATSRAFRRLQVLGRLAASRIELLERRDHPSRHEIESCRIVIAGVVHAHDAFASEGSERLGGRQADELSAEAGSALSRLSDSADRKQLSALDDQATRLAVDRHHRLGILGADGFAVVAPLIAGAVAECEDVFGKLLRAIGPDVVEAGRILRLLHAECPQGVPALLGADALERATRAAQLSITPRALPLELIYEALRLVRMAERLEGDTGIPLAVPEDADREEPLREAPAESGDTEGTADSPPLGPSVDLPGLVAAAERLNDTLESAWSGALDRAMTDQGIKTQLAAVRAAVAGYQRKSNDDKVRLEEFPPGHRVLEHLEKDRERMRERIVTAQLTAFVELLKSLESLTKPTRVQVRISQDGADELTRFWESGAFERLRGLLGLLREMLASDDRPQVLGVHRRLRLAQAAWYSGDPEGCLFHAACALSRQLALPVGELEASLPHDERSPTAAAALRALDAELRGEQALDLAALTAPALADLASDTAMPTSRERGMTGQELYELLAQDLPHVPLEDE